MHGEMSVIDDLAESWLWRLGFYGLRENQPPVNEAQFAEMMKVLG